MRQVNVLILGVCLAILVSCSADPTTSNAYQVLEQQVSLLNDDLSNLRAQIAKAEDELAGHQEEKESFLDQVDTLIGAKSQRMTAINEAESKIDELANEIQQATDARNALNAEISDFKDGSSRYWSAVRNSISSHQRYLCQQQWKADLSPLISDLDPSKLSSNVGQRSSFSDADMREVDSDFKSIDCGLWGEDTLFGGEETVLNRVCERVNIEKLKKNPSSYRGQCFRGTSARVAQFDTATGPRTFHATLGSRYGERVEFNLVRMSGESLYEGVRFDWWAVGNGSLTYTTSIGGSMTIPSFTIFWYRYYS